MKNKPPGSGFAASFSAVRDRSNPTAAFTAIAILGGLIVMTLVYVIVTHAQASAQQVDPLAKARASNAQLSSAQSVQPDGAVSSSIYNTSPTAPYVLPSVAPDPTPAPTATPAARQYAFTSNAGGAAGGSPAPCDPRYPFGANGACVASPPPQPSPQPAASPGAPGSDAVKRMAAVLYARQYAATHNGATPPPGDTHVPAVDGSGGSGGSGYGPSTPATPMPAPTIEVLFASNVVGQTNARDDAQDTAPSPAPGPSPSPDANLNANEPGYLPIRSKRQVGIGTNIPMRLITTVVSTVPGYLCAQTTAPVYDSATHLVIVIPTYTIACGPFGNAIVNGQNRLAASIATLRFPNGREFNLAGQPIVDAGGASGVAGDYDKHFGPVLTSAALLTVLGTAEAAIAPQTGGSIVTSPSVGDQARSAGGTQLNNVGNATLGQSLSRAPTIILRPPTVINVMVTRDLPLEDYEIVRRQ